MKRVDTIESSLSLSFSLSLTHSAVGVVFGSALFSNQLSGTIPSTIGSLTNLQYLYDATSISTANRGDDSTLSLNINLSLSLSLSLSVDRSFIDLIA